MSKTSRIVKFTLTPIVSALILAGCGGGGSGSGRIDISQTYPGASITNPGARVPFTTPRLVAEFDPLARPTIRASVSSFYTQDITGDGGQDLIYATRMSQPATPDEWIDARLSMMTWKNGQLVDATAQWFPNDSNIIRGTEPSVEFADFNRDGKLDMFVVPSTDMQYYAPASYFANQGTQFSRQDIALDNVWGHGSDVYDLNQDGWQDVIIPDYGPNTTMVINDRNGGFITLKPKPGDFTMMGGADIAAADFLGDGSVSLILIDTGTPGNPSELYGFDIKDSHVEYTKISTLPTPRFELPKWAGYNFGGGDGNPSHNVRVVAFDFDDVGLTDALVFSRPSRTDGVWPKYSEIQFLKNQGGGDFIDVTDDILVGYNTNTVVTYNPKFLDLNNDGKTDILVSGADFDGTNNSHQFLLKSSDGKFVAAYQNILTDFASQASFIQGQTSSACNCDSEVNLIRDPEGKLHLVTNTSFVKDGVRRQAVYMSELKSDGTVYTPQLSVDLLQQAWPYLTAGDANQALLESGKSYLGATQIDLENAFRPVGNLGLALNGRLGPVQPLSGYIAGVNLSDHHTKMVAVDGIRRHYEVDLSGTKFNKTSVWRQTRNVPTAHARTMPSQAQNLVGSTVTEYDGFRVSQNPEDLNMFTVGTPGFKMSDHWSFHTQLTALNFSPWLQMDGVWGKVNDTLLTEFVFSYDREYFVANTGLMYAKTDITPGLITNVSDIWSVWTEVGFRDQESGWGAFVGMKPWALTGQVDARIPTGVDQAGNMSYTDVSAPIQNSFDMYMRIAYTSNLTKRLRASVGAIMFHNGQHGITGSISYAF